MKLRNILAAATAGLCASLAGHAAQAEKVHVAFSGVAIQTQAEIQYPTIWGVDAYGQNIIGDPFTATFTYNTGAGTTTLYGGPEYVNYQALTAGHGTFTIGGHTYTVRNGYQGDQFQSSYLRSTGEVEMEMCSVGSCFGGDYFEVGTTSPISANLDGPLSLGAGDIVGGIGDVVLSGPNKGDLFGNFSVNSLNIAGVIPEPATWALMLVGFGGLGAALRSRRRMAAVSA